MLLNKCSQQKLTGRNIQIISAL